ncbi:hypothetical protein [Methylophaga lonarensis]|uniref:hypothetical protein n=1 Tax=Methylophaga lonarensis TaxID=999151 RepID=UPI003D2B8F9B
MSGFSQKITKSLLAVMLITLASACAADAPPIPVTVQIATDSGKPINPLLLGSNIQWVDRGDGLLDPQTHEPIVSILDNARKMGVSALRYPGGSLSDLYHWRDGVGEISSRGINQRFHGAGEDRVLMGTAEFLYVSQQLGATPIITVNMITGTPEEAAAWVRATNIDGLEYKGQSLPKVSYWEIGNEPYLIDDNQKNLAIAPEAFAERANEYIKAMRAVDPSIKVGLPLRSDTLVGVPATPLPGYNRAVLQGVTERIDFVAVHDAYYPYIHAGSPDYSQIYLAAMGAASLVEKNLHQTRQELAKYRSERDIQIALTEYNAMYTLTGQESDGFIASWMAAMYLTDLLMMLSVQDDLLMANHWSLIGNWYFGALGLQAEKRPAFYVFESFNKVLNGQQLQTRVESPVFKTPQVGFAPAQTNQPFVNAISTREGDTLRLLVLNKHPMQAADVQLKLAPARTIDVREAVSLSSDSVFHYDVPQAAVKSRRLTASVEHGQLNIELPPHSLSIIEIGIQ